jgi:hypothetical protein
MPALITDGFYVAVRPAVNKTVATQGLFNPSEHGRAFYQRA